MRAWLQVIFPLYGLFALLRRLARVPEFRALLWLEAGLIFSGTIFFHFVEKWDWLDAMYFCVVTLATVGFGDFHPVTPWGKIFTMVYIVFGVALLGVFIQIAGKTTLETLQARTEKNRVQNPENESLTSNET